MKNALLSIVVPAYKAEKFIVAAIQSFLAQHVEWAEMIIVDDGSPDKTHAQCLPYISEKVRYIRIPNGGAGHARNVGVEAARGKWIAFLDADDLMAPDALPQMYEALAAPNNQTDIYYCSVVCCGMDLEGKRILQPESLENIKHHIPQREFWACIYLKEFMEKAHVRFFEYREQDVETAFRFRAFSRTKRIQRRADVVWVWHRNNPDSNVNTWNLVTLCRVKSLIYLELFKEYTAGDASVSEHLYGVYLEFFRKFMAHLKEQGPPEQANMRDYRRQIVILSKGLSLGKHISQNDEYRQFSTWAQRLKYPFKARLLLAAIGKKRNATHGRPEETNRRFFNSLRRKGI